MMAAVLTPMSSYTPRSEGGDTAVMAEAHDDTDSVEAILAARQGVVIPAALRDAERSREMTPRAIEDAFLAGNPGLSRDGMAVICAGRRLIEVRLCLTPGLDFRGCREVRAETCRGNDPIALPAAP